MSIRSHNIPFAPRRCPFFYGWIIVVAAILCFIASIPGQTNGVGVFTEYLLDTLRLSALQLSAAYMLGTILSSFMLPFAGNLLDRYGTRAAVVVASFGLAFSLFVLSQCGRLAALMSVSTVVWPMIVSIFCFLLIRFFGQGCLAMISRVLIGKWFNHRRGLAVGIAGVFIAFGFNSGPLVLNALVQAVGWRESCLILAAAVGVGMGFLGWLLVRDNPEECGLQMDGVSDPDWKRKIKARAHETTREFTRKEAAGTLAFWAFTLCSTTHGFVTTGLFFHLTEIAGEAELNRAEVYSLVLYLPLFGVPMNLVAGWLSDRINLKWLLVTMMVTNAIGTIGLLYLATPLGQGMMVVGYGMAGGVFGTMINVPYPRFFGREHLGAISGLNMFVMVFSSAIAPLTFSLGKFLTESFQSVTAACLVLPSVVILLGLCAKNPQEK